MSELSVTYFKQKIIHELELAREKVRLLEDQLQWFDDETTKEDNTSQDNKKDELEKQPLLAPVYSSDENTPGRAIRELMENAPGEFNVPGIVGAIKRDFPDIEYPVLSKKGSQLANRLAKINKIKLVKKGVGREPNIYISAKYSSS